jgi:hypothetical protein
MDYCGEPYAEQKAKRAAAGEEDGAAEAGCRGVKWYGTQTADKGDLGKREAVHEGFGHAETDAPGGESEASKITGFRLFAYGGSTDEENAPYFGQFFDESNVDIGLNHRSGFSFELGEELDETELKEGCRKKRDGAHGQGSPQLPATRSPAERCGDHENRRRGEC